MDGEDCLVWSTSGWAYSDSHRVSKLLRIEQLGHESISRISRVFGRAGDFVLVVHGKEGRVYSQALECGGYLVNHGLAWMCIINSQVFDLHCVRDISRLDFLAWCWTTVEGVRRIWVQEAN